MTPIPTRRRVNPQEVVYALIVLAHGIIWSLPSEVFPLSINYRALAALAPEWLWGIVWLIAGLLWLAAIRSHVLLFRRASATIGAFLLTFLGVSFFASNPNTTIGWVVALCGVGSALVRWELR